MLWRRGWHIERFVGVIDRSQRNGVEMRVFDNSFEIFESKEVVVDGLGFSCGSRVFLYTAMGEYERGPFVLVDVDRARGWVLLWVHPYHYAKSYILLTSDGMYRIPEFELPVCVEGGYVHTPDVSIRRLLGWYGESFPEGTPFSRRYRCLSEMFPEDVYVIH